MLVKEDNLVSTHWPLAKVINTFPAKDGHTRVVSVKTVKGIYKCPTAKIVLLLPQEGQNDGASFGGRDVEATQAQAKSNL